LTDCRAATFGSCVRVIGLLKVSEHDRQPVEVVAESIDVIGASNVEVMV